MDVPSREYGAADDEVILFIEVDDSFSIVCEVTYSMLSHDSFSVLVDAPNPCIEVSKKEHDVVSWNVVDCRLQGGVEIIHVLFICVFNGGVGHDNGEFDVTSIQPYAE